jgi:hypothetical protein
VRWTDSINNPWEYRPSAEGKTKAECERTWRQNKALLCGMCWTARTFGWMWFNYPSEFAGNIFSDGEKMPYKR